MNPQHAARRLRPFLAGSVVLHLAVLASAAAMRLDVSGTPAISVRLETDTALVVSLPAGAAGGAAAGAASAAISDRRDSSRLKPLLQNQQIAAYAVEESSRAIMETNARAGAADTAAEQAEDSSTQSAAASVELSGRIESDLARFFHYPPLARREGWEGVVQLQFDVAGDGAIQNIQLASSSGYALLDRAAQVALATAGHVTVPPSLAGGARAIALPVHYRLTEAR